MPFPRVAVHQSAGCDADGESQGAFDDLSSLKIDHVTV